MNEERTREELARRIVALQQHRYPNSVDRWELAQLLKKWNENEVCDNCGSPLVVVRSREGRFCTSECAEAFELS